MTRENTRGGVIPTTSAKPNLEANLFAFVKIGDGIGLCLGGTPRNRQGGDGGDGGK